MIGFNERLTHGGHAHFVRVKFYELLDYFGTALIGRIELLTQRHLASEIFWNCPDWPPRHLTQRHLVFPIRSLVAHSNIIQEHPL